MNVYVLTEEHRVTDHLIEQEALAVLTSLDDAMAAAPDDRLSWQETAEPRRRLRRATRAWMAYGTLHTKDLTYRIFELPFDPGI